MPRRFRRRGIGDHEVFRLERRAAREVDPAPVGRPLGGALDDRTVARQPARRASIERKNPDVALLEVLPVGDECKGLAVG